MSANGTPRRLVAVAFATGCACVLAAVTVIAGSDRAGAAAAKAAVIGQTPITPKPNCPTPAGATSPPTAPARRWAA